MKKYRCYFSLGLCLVFLATLNAGQDRPVLKTVSQELMGALSSPNYDNDRLNFYSPAGEDYWVPFSADGRRLLPQLSVALADPGFVKWAQEVWLKGELKKNISCVDSFLGLKAVGLGEMRLPAGDFLPVSNFHYSLDLKHWAVALIDTKGKNRGVTIVRDSEIVQRIEPPLAGRGLGLMPNAFGVSGGSLMAEGYTMDFNADTSQDELPVSDLTLSPDGSHLAFVVMKKVAGGLFGKWRACVVCDGEEGAGFDGIASGSLTFTPDSRHFAYFAAYDRAKNTATLVYDGREVPLKGVGGSWLIRGNSLRFQLSPDGRYVIIPVGHTSGFGDYKQRYRIIDLQEPQGPASNVEFVDVAFSRDGSKHLIVEETATKQQKVQGFGDHEYFKVKNLALSEDGTHSAWAANYRGKWVAVVDGQHRKPYLEIQYLTLSPDGKHVAYAAKNDQKKWVFVLDDVEWGPYDKIEEPRPDDYSKYYPDIPVFFSSDGQHAAITVKQDKLASLVVDGTVVASFKKMGTPVFSPDGKRTAVWASDGDKEFIVLDGKALPGFKEIDKWQIFFSPDGRHVAYKAKINKQWFPAVDDTPSANGFDVILTTRPDKKGIVFSAPDAVCYVGLKGKMLYLVDEKIETASGENK